MSHAPQRFAAESLLPPKPLLGSLKPLARLPISLLMCALQVFRWVLLRIGLASGESSPVFRSFHGAALLLERVAALRARRLSTPRGSISQIQLQMQRQSQRRLSGASIRSGSTAVPAGHDGEQDRSGTLAAAWVTGASGSGAAAGLGRAKFTEALVTASLVKSGGRLQLVSTAAAGLREVLDGGLIPALRADMGPAMPGSMPHADAFRRDAVLLRPVETELLASVPALLRLIEAAEAASAPTGGGGIQGAAARSARRPGGDGKAPYRPGPPAVTITGWVRFLRGCGLVGGQSRQWGMTVSEAKWHFLAVQCPSLDSTSPGESSEGVPAAPSTINGTGFAEAMVRLAASPGSWHLLPARALRQAREPAASTPRAQLASSLGGHPDQRSGEEGPLPKDGAQADPESCRTGTDALPVSSAALSRPLSSLTLGERVGWLLRVLEHTVARGGPHWELVGAAAADEAATEARRSGKLSAAWLSMFHAAEAFKRCEAEVAVRSPSETVLG